MKCQTQFKKNQQSSTVLSSTWTLGTQNSNEKSISNSRKILFYCMTPLKKQTSNHCSFYILYVGTSFRHSACSRYNFKCDFIRKKSWKKSCVCVLLLLEGTTRWKRKEKKRISRSCYVLDDVKLNFPLLVVSACVKISEKSILEQLLEIALLVATWTWMKWINSISIDDFLLLF